MCQEIGQVMAIDVHCDLQTQYHILVQLDHSRHHICYPDELESYVLGQNSEEQAGQPVVVNADSYIRAGGCLMGVGATGGITGCESRDEGHVEGGESSTRGTGASMGGSAGMSVGIHVDHLTGLSHLGNCASENSACTVVKRTLLGECMNRKLASLPGATPRYTRLRGKFICPNVSWKEDIHMLCIQIHASG